MLPEPEAITDGYRINHLDERRDIMVEEVAKALERVRAALIAARLDSQMLVRHYTAAVDQDARTDVYEAVGVPGPRLARVVRLG